MPRKKFIPTSDVPYFVTARSRNQEWYSLDMDTVWNIFSDYLFLVSSIFNLEIHCVVLMNNHFHMIVRTPDANLDKAMNYFMREVSKEICRLSDRKNQIFGGPYHRTLLIEERHYYNAYRYTYQNPVRAGICQHVEDYRYSTLFGLLGKSHLIIPIVGENILFDNPYGALPWLNEKIDEETNEAIRFALKKDMFKISKNSYSGKIAELKVPQFDQSHP